MAMFGSVVVDKTPKTHDEVVASMRVLVDALDKMSKVFAESVKADEAHIVALQLANTNATAEKAKVDDMSAKLKALLPPDPVKV